MQREIKFRAWDGKQIHYNIPIASVSVGIFLEMKGCAMELMQYTGLKDKNGKEIYEGDILDSSFPIVIEWDKRTVSFVARRDITFPLRIDGVYQVIGNIYENPELLTNWNLKWRGSTTQ